MRRALVYAPALIWAGLLVYIGGRSNVPRVESPLPLDKAAHFVMYGILGGMATMGWRAAGQTPRLLWVLALASLVGVIDEVNQSTVPGRSPDIMDWLADAVGIAAAALLILRITREKKINVV